VNGIPDPGRASRAVETIVAGAARGVGHVALFVADGVDEQRYGFDDYEQGDYLQAAGADGLIDTFGSQLVELYAAAFGNSLVELYAAAAELCVRILRGDQPDPAADTPAAAPDPVVGDGLPPTAPTAGSPMHFASETFPQYRKPRR
jgi:hypothetical protein